MRGTVLTFLHEARVGVTAIGAAAVAVMAANVPEALDSPTTILGTGRSSPVRGLLTVRRARDAPGAARAAPAPSAP